MMTNTEPTGLVSWPCRRLIKAVRKGGADILLHTGSGESAEVQIRLLMGFLHDQLGMVAQLFDKRTIRLANGTVIIVEEFSE